MARLEASPPFGAYFIHEFDDEEGDDIQNEEDNISKRYAEHSDSCNNSCVWDGMDIYNEGWKEQLIVATKQEGKALEKFDDTMDLLEKLIYGKKW